MTAASAQAGATPFMPRGEGVGAPIGFVDLCRRDLATCGVPASQLALLGVEAPTGLAPTASLGGVAGQRHFLGAAPSASVEDEAEAKLISVETVEAFVMAPVEDFVPAGQARPEAPRAATPDARFAWANRAERDQLKLLNQVNQSVNREVRKASDLELYGVDEYWSLPRVINGKKYGDCEDYALEKRRQLIEAGVPESALSLAVAVTARGESHAVLMISLKSGDWVLDNLTPWATPWQDLNYHWVERQVPGTALWTTA
ncbi:transglutaminase-like cysteine peptidase [uncultured Caulobacter sp.]|uniref:transglutaminase-like cysteine peptidase n=1 Tax=uncultured Caulobacter sp. TaxID=158749 RepID=UPI0026284FB0|nr:transglutaminase-like cysteine peptidase [uncultured Caulobacter sp.]